MKLRQGGRRRGPLHPSPVVGHVSDVIKPPLHLPEVSLHLVALVAAHDGVDGPQAATARASQRATPHLQREESLAERRRGCAPVPDANVKVGQSKEGSPELLSSLAKTSFMISFRLGSIRSKTSRSNALARQRAEHQLMLKPAGDGPSAGRAPGWG